MNGGDLVAVMPAVARALLGDPVPHLSTATEWRYGRRGSLSVDIARGLWCDHEAGTGGGVIALIQRQRGGDTAAALRWLGDGLGGFQRPIAGARAREIVPLPERDDAKRISDAIRIWRGAMAPAGTAVEVYLASRGLALGLLGGTPADRIRFALSCPFGPGVRRPVMLSLLSDLATGVPVGIRRTALTIGGERATDQTGAKLPHKVLGRARNAVARLAGITEPPPVLGLCEGVESGLSVIAATGGIVWACPAGTLAKVPILPGVERLTIYADNDPPGLKAARETACRWRAAGRQTCIETPAREGADFNDLLKGISHD